MSYPVEKKLPKVFGSIDITAVFALLVTGIIWFIFYKTKWGLRVRAVGEHPAAADTLGVKVYKIRYICVILSGLMAGFAGGSMTLSIVSQF